MTEAAVGPSADGDAPGTDAPGTDAPGTEAPESTATPLLAPREGVPDLIVSQAGLDAAIAALVAGYTLLTQ